MSFWFLIERDIVQIKLAQVNFLKNTASFFLHSKSIRYFLNLRRLLLFLNLWILVILCGVIILNKVWNLKIWRFFFIFLNLIFNNSKNIWINRCHSFINYIIEALLKQNLRVILKILRIKLIIYVCYISTLQGKILTSLNSNIKAFVIELKIGLVICLFWLNRWSSNIQIEILHWNTKWFYFINWIIASFTWLNIYVL